MSSFVFTSTCTLTPSKRINFPFLFPFLFRSTALRAPTPHHTRLCLPLIFPCFRNGFAISLPPLLPRVFFVFSLSFKNFSLSLPSFLLQFSSFRSFSSSSRLITSLFWSFYSAYFRASSPFVIAFVLKLSSLPLQPFSSSSSSFHFHFVVCPRFIPHFLLELLINRFV